MSPTLADLMFGPQADARLAAALALAGVFLWEIDLESQRLRFSPQAGARMGLDGDDAAVADWRARVHADDAPLLFDPAANPVQAEVRYLRADGSWGMLLATVVDQRQVAGTPRLRLGLAVDVTDQRRAALELRQANERAALAARGAGIGTWLLDLQTQQALWDEQMWALRGLQPQPDAPDREAQLALVHPLDRELMRSQVGRAVAAGSVAQYEFRIVRPDGQVRWLASRSTPVFDAQGRAVRRVGVNWDVTDAREAERSRQDAEMARRERRTQSELLARMSHELRTPLNAVMGFVQLMQADEQQNDAAAALRRERLGQIGAAGQRLLGLVDQVLQLSGQPEPAAPPPIEQQVARRGTLLYIEDNPVNALIVSELLRRRPDLRLHVAGTGIEGVRLAEQLLPSLVLLDMQLPDIDGFEVLRRLRALPDLAATPVVALSANAMPRDIQRALDAGMSAYWTKPLDFKAFTASIEAMFGPPPLAA